MLNRVWRCRTHTFYVIISQLAPPLPHRWTDDDAENGQAGEQARAQGWGCRGGTMRPCNGIYILFSVPLCFSNSLLTLRSSFH